MRPVLYIIGTLSVIYGISGLIQSFRHEDTAMALRQEGISQDPKTTSRRLRIMSVIFITIGIIIFLY